MSGYVPDKSNTIIPFAPTPKPQPPEANVVADDSGRTIISLLQKAAEMAKDDCARAMDLAHKLSFQLRTAEAEAAHFRDRASRAEAWLLRIHNEVEQTFFHQKKERDPRQDTRPVPRQ